MEKKMDEWGCATKGSTGICIESFIINNKTAYPIILTFHNSTFDVWFDVWFMQINW